ncbi:MAG: hypothetical protein HC893_03515 [Chloroflexaceae bacterium]|nr:hypothetical protein [Chloroflexaceae bacterium]
MDIADRISEAKARTAAQSLAASGTSEEIERFTNRFQETFGDLTNTFMIQVGYAPERRAHALCSLGEDQQVYVVEDVLMPDAWHVLFEPKSKRGQRISLTGLDLQQRQDTLLMTLV